MINMKKTLLIFALALLAVSQMAAQDYDYIPFVREGVKWVCDYEVNLYQSNHKTLSYYLEFSGDSVINGKTYKAMHKYSGQAIDPANDTIPVFMREDNRVVYGIVPDGKTYQYVPVGCVSDEAMNDKITAGEEFILYDFNDPEGFIDSLYSTLPLNYQNNKYYKGSFTQTISIEGKPVKRYIFRMYNVMCFVEGIGGDSHRCTSPIAYNLMGELDARLNRVIKGDDTIYTAERLKVQDEDDEFLPVVREGTQWINEKVVINQGDTVRSYYTYELRGQDSRKHAYCHYYEGATVDNGPDQIVAKLYPGYEIPADEVWSEDNIPRQKVVEQGRHMINSYGSWPNVRWLYQFEYGHSVLSPYGPIWTFISSQRGDDLTFDNFYEVEPVMIEGVQCSRYAYVGEQGDTLAYVVEGIGFDSRDMGDLLTPFTRKPDPTADYQEWCGLSHVVRDGQIIYKGMRYRDGALDGIDEVVADKSPRSLDDNYYNLMGQPVGKDLPTLPGIYIHHGNKILVR